MQTFDADVVFYGKDGKPDWQWFPLRVLGFYGQFVEVEWREKPGFWEDWKNSEGELPESIDNAASDICKTWMINSKEIFRIERKED